MKEPGKQLAVVWLLLPVLTFAQENFRYQRDFSPEEFAQRRAKVFEIIGADAVAVLQGAPAALGLCAFHQNNEFFYLCGIPGKRSGNGGCGRRAPMGRSKAGATCATEFPGAAVGTAPDIQ